MSKLMRNVLLLLKIQPVAGTDPVPTAPLNAILCRAITPQPISAEFVDRDNIRPYFGNAGSVLAAIHSECEFEVEMAGSGTAGTAPKWAPLLRACGFAETLVAVTSASYAPITNGQEAATLYYYLDGILHKMTDAKGSVSFSLSAKGIPVMRFKFVGLYTTPTDSATPTTADYSGFKDPLAVNAVNTPTWSLHGFTGKLASLDIDVANQITYRNLVGGDSVVLTDRKPAGSAVMELEAVATKDWWTTIKNNTLGALSITHGVTAGNIIQITAPKVQLTNPAYSDSDGIAMITTSLNFQPNIGNDELVIVSK